MKKILTVVLALVMTAVGAIAIIGCTKPDETNYVAKEIAGVEVEEYGFAVGKNSTKKTEILNAMNEVINSTDIDAAVAYYTALSSDQTPTGTLEFADLSDNTAGTLKVYTCSGFEPYEFIGADQSVIGVDIYLMELVCEKLNMKISVEDVDFNTICGKVAAEDNAIGAAGITITEERMETIDFSTPYYSSVQCIISAEEQSYTDLAALAGKKIGVQKGTTGALMVFNAINEEGGALYGTGAEVVEYDKGSVAYMALKQGKIDYIVIDKLPAQKLVSGN